MEKVLKNDERRERGYLFIFLKEKREKIIKKDLLVRAIAIMMRSMYESPVFFLFILVEIKD